MTTEYCDRYTYFQVYGHYPPEDGSYDPALGNGDEVLNVTVQPEVTAKVVQPDPEQPAKPKRSRNAETK
jgi:hypothetical protein